MDECLDAQRDFDSYLCSRVTPICTLFCVRRYEVADGATSFLSVGAASSSLIIRDGRAVRLDYCRAQPTKFFSNSAM